MKRTVPLLFAVALLAAAGCNPNHNAMATMWGPDKPLHTLPVLQSSDKDAQRHYQIQDGSSLINHNNGPKPPVAAVKRIPLGASALGRPLTLYVFGTAPRPTFIFGGIHGDEGVSAEIAGRLLDHITNNPSAWAGRSVAILTAANPDGLAANTRGNAHGIDCNRNFPASNFGGGRGGRYNGGSKAGSEPETRAIIKAVETLQPGRIISLHCISPGKHCNNYDGPGESLAAKMSACNHYPVKASIGYPTPGSFGTWAGIDRGIPTITLEFPAGHDASSLWPANKAALLAAVHDQPSTLGK